MLEKITVTSLPESSLPVMAAGGYLCHLTAVLMPVRQADGRLIALELLSRIHYAGSGISLPSEVFFRHCPAAEQVRIFSWQLTLIERLSTWCRVHEVLLSVNITRSLGISILSSRELSAQVQGLDRVLRLELSEYFIRQGCAPGEDPLIQGISALSPLWLDDLGAGTAGFCWMLTGIFEFVKLDRHLLERLYFQLHGREFLQALNLLAQDAGGNMVVEGVANEAYWQFVRDCDAAAGQGRLWPAVELAALNGLALQQTPGKKENNLHV